MALSDSFEWNPDAYLLFYKRRTSRPLGGKTQTELDQCGAVNGTSRVGLRPAQGNAYMRVADELSDLHRSSEGTWVQQGRLVDSGKGIDLMASGEAKKWRQGV